jgi:uncharacterized membrane protein YfhO
LKYDYSAAEESFVVFSEIFYDKGWSVTIDGKSAEAIRVDYILRGMELPAGRHTVEWHFRAPNWGVVNCVTALCSALVVAFLIFALYKKQNR